MNTCISRCRVECVRQYGNDVWCVSTLVGVALCAVIFAEKVSFLLRSVKVVLWQCIYGSMYDHEMNGSHKSRGGWHLWKTAVASPSARALRPRRAVACHRARWLARARVATGSMSDDILEAERLLEYVFGAAKKLIYLILSFAWRCGWVPNPSPT